MAVVKFTFPSNPTPEQLDEINAAMDAWQDAIVEEQTELANEYGVSSECAAVIQYLPYSLALDTGKGTAPNQPRSCRQETSRYSLR